jgi:hypothetical protein
MPLFVMISGMVSAFWICQQRSNAYFSNLKNAGIQLNKSILRLLVPFISWTIFRFFYDGIDESLSNYLYRVFKNPDQSLWFLVCIFLCIAFFLVSQILCDTLFNFFKLQSILKNYLPQKFNLLGLQLLLTGVFWFLLKNKIPYAFGGLLKQFFPYFFLGVLSSTYLNTSPTKMKRIIPYVLFVLLAPFWYRDTPNNLQTPIHNLLGSSITAYYLIVALSGSFVLLDVSKMIYRANWPGVNKSIEYCGKMSLGIYAIHFYFLSVLPPIIAPLVISLIASTILLRIPVLSTLLLGERFHFKKS